VQLARSSTPAYKEFWRNEFTVWWWNPGKNRLTKQPAKEESKNKERENPSSQFPLGDWPDNVWIHQPRSVAKTVWDLTDWILPITLLALSFRVKTWGIVMRPETSHQSLVSLHFWYHVESSVESNISCITNWSRNRLSFIMLKPPCVSNFSMLKNRWMKIYRKPLWILFGCS